MYFGPEINNNPFKGRKKTSCTKRGQFTRKGRKRPKNINYTKALPKEEEKEWCTVIGLNLWARVVLCVCVCLCVCVWCVCCGVYTLCLFSSFFFFFCLFLSVSSRVKIKCISTAVQGHFFKSVCSAHLGGSFALSFDSRTSRAFSLAFPSSLAS